MAGILSNLNKVVVSAFVLAALLIVLYIAMNGFNGAAFWPFVVRWLHVLSGVMWIGLLYFFNFVQMIAMPGIPDEQKPAVSKHIAPRALFWFRWAALSTLIFGLILAHMNGYIVEALTLDIADAAGAFSNFNVLLIGIGMWLGIIMAFNVWMIIWPNQKKALGIVEASADEKKKAARTAMLFSRTNTLLSVPMLFCMVGAQNLG